MDDLLDVFEFLAQQYDAMEAHIKLNSMARSALRDFTEEGKG